MKLLKMIVVAIACASAGAAMADASKPVDVTQPHNMYVVADVLPNGELAAIHPYERLSPQLTGLLRKTVASWLTGPAVVDGRRSYSRVLFHVALQAEPVTRGQYSAKFAYLSAEPFKPANSAVRSRFPGASVYAESAFSLQSPGTLAAFENRGIVPTRP